MDFELNCINGSKIKTSWAALVPETAAGHYPLNPLALCKGLLSGHLRGTPRKSSADPFNWRDPSAANGVLEQISVLIIS